MNFRLYFFIILYIATITTYAVAEKLCNLNQELFKASSKGDNTKILTLLGLGADVNIVDEIGETPLMKAALFNNNNTVELLIKKGANVNAHSKGGVTALIKTIMVKESIDTAELLIKHGANVNAITEIGSALDWSCNIHPSYIMTKLLIKNGAILDGISQNSKDTLYFWASKYKDVELNKLLVDTFNK